MKRARYIDIGCISLLVVCQILLSVPRLLASLATVPMLLHIETTWSSEYLSAELPFALGSVLFLLAARRAKGKSREWLAGGLAVTCFLLRSIGIALLAA